MKIELLIILFSLFSCTEKMEDISNIEITNKTFIELISNFLKNHCKGINNKEVSVSITIISNDTTIGLYADKKLKWQYYIGYLKIDSDEIYFYADGKASINGLYNVVSEPKVKVDSSLNYTETYTNFFNYQNGIFILEKP